MIQFLLESFCINFIALMFALGIVSSVLTLISRLLEKPLAFSLLDDKMFLLYAALAYVVGSLASGLYPAIILSAFKPVSIFKSASAGMGKGNAGLRSREWLHPPGVNTNPTSEPTPGIFQFGILYSKEG